MTSNREERAARLHAAHLYLVTDLRPGGRDLAAVLRPALAGGVDVVQLRDKGATDDEVLAAAVVARALCDEVGALLVVNDRPDLARRAGADAVHLGQDDATLADARTLVGAELLIGRSTHSPDQLAAAEREGADYLGVGPVHATPTKRGRAPVGLAYVRHAADHANIPWFAIGGIDHRTLPSVVGAGARRVAVVRAITLADDPSRAAAALLPQRIAPATTVTAGGQDDGWGSPGGPSIA